jgi:hypothetical protein
MTQIPRIQDVAWCASLFQSLAPGGTWGVPRSGLIFQKRDGKLVLINRMPHEILAPEFAMSEKELLKFQDEDYDVIKLHFEGAGIPVEKGDEGGNS